MLLEDELLEDDGVLAVLLLGYELLELGDEATVDDWLELGCCDGVWSVEVLLVEEDGLVVLPYVLLGLVDEAVCSEDEVDPVALSEPLALALPASGLDCVEGWDWSGFCAWVDAVLEGDVVELP